LKDEYPFLIDKVGANQREIFRLEDEIRQQEERFAQLQTAEIASLN
jgi:hypothetical protein